MILEIASIVSVVNTATKALSAAAQTTSDIQQISGFITQLGQAQVDIQAAQKEGKLTEADAIQAALTKKKIDDTMASIREMFYYSGNADLWENAMRELANARKRRVEELKKERARLEKIRKRNRMIVGGIIAVVFVAGAIWMEIKLIIGMASK